MSSYDHVNKVAIVDDHPATARGVALALESSADIKVTIVANSFADLVDALTVTPADVLFLDLVRIGVPPVTAVTSLRIRYPDLKVVILSSDILGAHQFLRRYGVKGYVAKEDSRDEVLQQAVQFVMRGQNYVSPTVVQKRANLREDLTPREIDVLQLLADGLRNEEIGAQLSITPGTVANTISILRRKLNLQERTALAAFYRRMIGKE